MASYDMKLTSEQAYIIFEIFKFKFLKITG